MLEILKGFTVAILVANGFQQDEMILPKKALEDAGATVYIVSVERDIVQGWDWNIPKALDTFAVDVHIDNAKPALYDALLLPGGLSSPDDLRLNAVAVNFVKTFENKPIAAICHGPWLLIDADLIKKGVEITSWPSIKRDLINAGATWIDKEVVRYKNLVTSRMPEDIEYFNKAMIELFVESNKKKSLS